MDNRTITISNTPLDAATLKDFLEQLTFADSMDGPINVCISSNGGDTMVAMAMFDAIRATRNKVTTVGLGAVGSAAVLVFSAGDERLIGPNASLFFHGTSVYAEGSFKNVKTINNEMERIHSNYCSLIAGQAGLDAKVVEGFCKKEMYMDADHAQKWGIATGKYQRQQISVKSKKKGKK